ncbi:hypothetical protein [Microbacterium sp. SORGH_AS_0888]|uniref:hypothetical protein n=1 Tax=Microbacterium sp. SORGH_AS_0888 TaxID=3041791 RepID=UPI002785EA94|nr:hypothetical protein [Microbacterium sp. SORGH_AS_0888]MDQ1129798.1 hypothetical protein [Microbacterium sp. SORGH_AS_0888]
MTDTTNPQNPASPERGLVHWMRAIDGLIRERFADAFAGEEPASREAARTRATELAHELRERIEGLVSPEDYATTIASLETIARGLGWDDTAAEFARGFGRPRFGRHGMRGFGPHPRHGFGPHGGFGRGFARDRMFRAGSDDALHERAATAHAECRRAGEDAVSR